MGRRIRRQGKGEEKEGETVVNMLNKGEKNKEPNFSEKKNTLRFA